MSCIAIHFDTICQLLGIQVARLVIVMILNQRPEFSIAGSLVLERDAVFHCNYLGEIGILEDIFETHHILPKILLLLARSYSLRAAI